MSQMLLKFDPKDHFLLKKIFEVLNAARLSSFCCFFTLKQGTIMIAIVELSLTSFCFFLLLLCATHAQDIVSLVTTDLQKLEENNLSEGVLEESSVYILNNEKKMLIGRHLAVIIMIIVWVGLLLSSINLISSSLLLYGAIRNSPNFLLPWTSTALISLISGCFFIILLSFVPFRKCKLGVFLILALLYALELYSWLVVFSYYQELKTLFLKSSGERALYSKRAENTIFVPQIHHETC